MAIDANEFRLRGLEGRMGDLDKRLNNIDEHGSRRVGVIEERVDNVSRGMHEFREEVKKEFQEQDKRISDLQGTITRAAVGVATSAVGSALFIWIVTKA